MRPLVRVSLLATAALMLVTSTASAQVGSDLSGSAVRDAVTPEAGPAPDLVVEDGPVTEVSAAPVTEVGTVPTPVGDDVPVADASTEPVTEVSAVPAPVVDPAPSPGGGNRLGVDGTDLLGPGSGIPGDGVIDPGPPPVAGVTVFADCVIVKRTGTTVWFGYENTLDERQVALVGASNEVAVNGVVSNQGQVTQFLPGRAARAFAVTVPVGAVPTWSVTYSNTQGLNGGSSLAAFSVLTPPCPAGVGVRSATPQIVGGLIPTISAKTVNERNRERDGLLVRSSLQFSINGVVSACAAGGTPLVPRVLWGYSVNPQGNLDGFIVTGAAAYQPLNNVVRVEQSATSTIDPYERTYQSTRRVVDPQRRSVYGTQKEVNKGTAQIAYGFSSVGVIADVEARCQFGANVVTSVTTVWVDPPGGSGFKFFTVTDRLTQATRPAVGCEPPFTTPGCDVRTSGIGPGGSKFR